MCMRVGCNGHLSSELHNLTSTEKQTVTRMSVVVCGDKCALSQQTLEKESQRIHWEGLHKKLHLQLQHLQYCYHCNGECHMLEEAKKLWNKTTKKSTIVLKQLKIQTPKHASDNVHGL